MAAILFLLTTQFVSSSDVSSLSATQPASSLRASDVSSLLRSLTFFHHGVVNNTSNFTRLAQCSGFTEDESVWLIGSPRAYLWDVSNGTTESTVRVPPIGLRSSVPLGGLGAGTFELRGDGTFADWMIENQGTALAANAAQNSKIPLKGGAFLALSLLAQGVNYSAALRTSPPPGVGGVPSLAYAGAYPFSQLSLRDPRSPVAASLFAYTAYDPAAPAEASAAPAAYFSLVLTNTLPTPLTASLLLSLPLGASADTLRPIGGDTRGQTLAVLPGVDGSGACLAACSGTPGCVWWNFEPATPGIPNTTLPNTDCPGNDLMAPPRVAFSDIQGCVDHCLFSVPGCTGLVFDQIPSEQGGQCGNSDPTKFCCLPKSACGPGGLAPKQGDTAWALGRPPHGATCTLFSKAPAVEQYFKGSGAASGVRGAFSTDSPASLTLHRDNGYDADPAAAAQDPASADATFTLLAADDDVDVTFAAANDVAGGVWAPFATAGRLPLSALPAPGAAAAHGAVAAAATLAPGETRSVTLVFAWHLPHRLYVGQELGNYYAALFNNSMEVAAAGAAGLTSAVAAGAAWNKVFAQASLPPAWADFFVNSVSTQAKMSVWVARDEGGAPLAGGRYRQFEAYSNCDLAPVHVWEYAFVPYAQAFPALLQNAIATGWLPHQLPNGMVREFLGAFSAPGGRITGEMDLSAGGRVMGDVTSIVLLAALAVLRSTNDTAWLLANFPALARAARWQMGTAAATGCPAHLQTTYDYLGLDAYPHVTYNAVLHLAAMRATARLAALAGDGSSLGADAAASEAACAAALGPHLWVEAPGGGGFWRAYQNDAGSAPDAILSGALHGLSWAHFVGLGGVLPLANVSAHVAAERALNCNYSAACELGLLSLPKGASGSWNFDASPAQSMDATAAAVIAGAGSLAGSVGEAAVALYRTAHADLWHWMDLHVGPAGLGCGGGALSGEFLAGQPFVNSHYARQLQGWHALLAETGQQYDATVGELTFAPACAGLRAAGWPTATAALPVFVPGALGILRVHGDGRAPALHVLRGRLRDGVAVAVDLRGCGGGAFDAVRVVAEGA
jgi:hypothetical protein